MRYQEVCEHDVLNMASLKCEKGCDAEDGAVAEPYFTV